jgi:hypothetical protein
MKLFFEKLVNIIGMVAAFGVAILLIYVVLAVGAFVIGLIFLVFAYFFIKHLADKRKAKQHKDRMKGA